MNPIFSTRCGAISERLVTAKPGAARRLAGDEGPCVDPQRRFRRLSRLCPAAAPSGRHFRARIQSSQCFAAPFAGDRNSRGGPLPPPAPCSVHTTQIAARIPSPACWGRWRHRASKDARLSTGYGAGWGVARWFDPSRIARTSPRTCGPSALLSTPHPSPSATPSPLRGEGGAPGGRPQAR